MPTQTGRKRYSPTEVEAALAVLAYYGGNSSRASQETGIADDLLRKWRLYTHRETYERIVAERAPELEALAVTNSREVMIRAGMVEHRILDELDQDGLTPKERSELAGAFQRVATAKGIETDKMLTMTNRPTQISEHREGHEILRHLGAMVPGLVIDGTATEVTPQPRELTGRPTSIVGIEPVPLVSARHESNAREASTSTD